jgi:enediyne polyketide synthase
MASIAIVGMACRYADARNPRELWENVLAQRRGFRRIPPERLRLEDYQSCEHDPSDCIYTTDAAVIEGYEFDRVRFKVSGDTFRSADMAHWLALDVAAQALADAGFPNAEGLPLNTTGVLVGNTLTGEFSRANQMRLRWPYVNRVLRSVLAKSGWTREQVAAVLEEMETVYKAPFPRVGEETLAGGLSNTIAGRICNYFDLKGGGYTLDAACASSLLAVAQACAALSSRDLDTALAGGVDLSLDPFELVGFARLGALADDEMRVFDRQSTGFLPGEGCGFVVLMRADEALAQSRHIYALIPGWGVASDGKGGITRPEVEGQLLALRRAYARAGFDINTVHYFEGHGTGTKVGDSTELRALSRARGASSLTAAPAVVGSIKANIGHTKAAAGVAGIIKAALAVCEQILPPTTGSVEPAKELTEASAQLRALAQAEAWPADVPLRAAVSAMGFGGINVHLLLEGAATERRSGLMPRDAEVALSAQDTELFLFDAASHDQLRRSIEKIAQIAVGVSRAELSDLASEVASRIEYQPIRAAAIASTPAELAARLQRLLAELTVGQRSSLQTSAGIFFGTANAHPKIGLVFPGQAAPVYRNGGALRRRFSYVDELFSMVALPAETEAASTALAQPAIVLNSLAALRVLARAGITSSLAVGHSLGELTALAWADAMDEETVLHIAAERGKAIEQFSHGPGAMASLAASPPEIEPLLSGKPVVVAGLNSPRQTVVSGEASAVRSLLDAASARGIHAVILPVAYAFHSPLVADAAAVVEELLGKVNLRPLKRSVFSTVTGGRLAETADLRALLRQHITSPVRFTSAIEAADREEIDLWIEAGPGTLMSGVMRELGTAPVISTDAGGPCLRGLLEVAAAAFIIGVDVRHRFLFDGRLVRPFDRDRRPKFFANPCEQAPLPDSRTEIPIAIRSRPQSRQPAKGSGASSDREPALELVRRLVAERAELPPSSVANEDRLLSDLHLNSITVAQLVVEAERERGVASVLGSAVLADATVAEVARFLAETAGNRRPSLENRESTVRGIDSWVEPFTVERVERPRHNGRTPSGGIGTWNVTGPEHHPLLRALRRSFSSPSSGSGVIVCLSADVEQQAIDLLLDGAKQLLRQQPPARLVIVQEEGSPVGAAFGRSFYMENPAFSVCVVTIPFDRPGTGSDWVLEEALNSTGYSEAQYDTSGRRTEAVLRHVALRELPPSEWPLGPDDVLLVTGGGKGITAESALALAREKGTPVAVLGRARLSDDPALQAGLQRFAEAKIPARYFQADISDAAQVRAVMDAVRGTLGEITALLHGAACNVPTPIRSLSKEAFLLTVAPKVQGFRNILAASDPDKLRLLITFGSVIARTGMEGEADYAFANEWLTHLTESWQAKYPHCRCLAVEWSVWSRLGMGERLGRIELLKQQGIVPVSPEAGTKFLTRLLSRRLPSVAVVATSRFREAPTLKLEQRPLPFLRFLEKTEIHYPGVELISDVQLSRKSDPYLDDHVLQGQRVLPAVIGLEAMVQVASATLGLEELPIIKQVEFLRPVVVPSQGIETIRIASLVGESGEVEVTLRSESTAYQVDHFRARIGFAPSGRDTREPVPVSPIPARGVQDTDLDGRKLYQSILFQKNRFQRLRHYRLLRAMECVAEVESESRADWFGHYLPQRLILGDPGGRDATIHAIQACVPHLTLLPTAVDRLEICARDRCGTLLVHARERCRQGNLFIYDVEVLTEQGLLVERWQGLRLQQVAERVPKMPWIGALLGPYIERRLQELMPEAHAGVVVESNHNRSFPVNDVLRPTAHRPPHGVRAERKSHAEASHVSSAQSNGLLLTVSGKQSISCDLDQVTSRTAEAWTELLGQKLLALAELIAQEANEGRDVSATRVRTALASIKKNGISLEAPLVLDELSGSGWIKLRSGEFMIVTLAIEGENQGNGLVAAISARCRENQTAPPEPVEVRSVHNAFS